MGANIASTLREKLFNHPDPIHREVEFAALVEEMFPGRSHFLLFLEQRHFEEQVDTAKHILLRLAYQARMSPPNKLLYNLLETESRLSGTSTKAAFNGRDHFVHLVNLYLLGIYVFWYHGQIHRRVREQFYDLAEHPSDRSQKEKNISACRGFLFAWREFVLFHDLGYAWEVSQGMENPSIFLFPYSEVSRYAIKDSALFALSQLLALEWLRKEEATVVLEKALRTYFGNPSTRQTDLFTAPEEVRLAWGKSERLPVTMDSALWQLICVIVPDEDRFSILETSAEGRPVACTNVGLHSLFSNSRISLEEELANHRELTLWSSINALPRSLKATYQWVHYARNYEAHFLRFAERLFSATNSRAREFLSFIHAFLDSFPPAQAIGEDLRFDDYAYAMFHRLLESLDFDSFDQEKGRRLVIYDKISQLELRGLHGRLLNEIGANLLSLLESRADKLDKEPAPKNITSLPLSDYLKELLRVLAETDELTHEVERKLSDQIKKKIDLKRQLYSYYDLLKREIAGRIRVDIPKLFAPDKTKQTGPATPEPRWSEFKQNALSKELNSMLTHRRLAGTVTLENYRPPWAPKPGNYAIPFADHGLASGLLYAEVFETWQAILADTSSALGQLLNLRGINEQSLQSVNPSHSPVHEVLYSILLHNLYPSSFREDADKRFRSRPDKHEAFTYFALLCDSLQPWDRKRLFNQATGSLPYTTYAENFNLEIDGSILRITERGDQLRIDERQAALRSYLNSYLERASDLVKLQLSEWR
jgi:hypothetical protein